MKIEGTVALVVGADSAVGAAIVHGLLARGAAKLYAASRELASAPSQAGTIALDVDPARAEFASALAQEAADVTLLVNCGVVGQPPGGPSPPVDRTLEVIDAFAPVLAGNGGGAVVNVLSVLCADPPLHDASPDLSGHAVDWDLDDGRQARLAAQQTLLLHVQAQLAVGGAGQVLEDQRALAGYVAMRVFDQLEARGGADEALRRSRAHSPQYGQEANE